MVYIDVDKIVENPNQPRKVFDKAKITKLSESIKEYGIIQPLSVRKKGSIYELIAGERRLLASKEAGLTQVPCVISNVEDNDSAIISLIENVQREDLSFYELALSYQKIIDEYSLTQSELANKLSVSQSSVANKLRILRLDGQLVSDLISNNLTERHARALLKLDDIKIQRKALKRIITKNYNVKQAEEYIDSLLLQSKPKRTVVKQSLKDIRVFTNTLKSLIENGEKAGLELDLDINQSDDFYEYVIRVQHDKYY